MAPKKAPALQAELHTQAEFDAFLAHDGLKVVDVYADWCGPCKTITGVLRKIKLDISDDKLHFAVAKTDTIESLAAYRNRSEPTFVFYGGADIVAVVRGCGASKITSTITEQLKLEHAVLAGTATRAVYHDPGPAAPLPSKDAAAGGHGGKTAAAAAAGPKEYTCALVLSVALENNMKDEIYTHIAEHGFKVVHEQERTFTGEEAAAFLAAYTGEANHEALVADLGNGGRIVAMVLARADAVQEWLQVLGPVDPDEASLHPECLRALYGANGLHGSKSAEDAKNEIAHLFPDWSPNPKAPVVAAATEESEHAATAAAAAAAPATTEESATAAVEAEQAADGEAAAASDPAAADPAGETAEASSSVEPAAAASEEEAPAAANADAEKEADVVVLDQDKEAAPES